MEHKGNGKKEDYSEEEVLEFCEETLVEGDNLLDGIENVIDDKEPSVEVVSVPAKAYQQGEIVQAGKLDKIVSLANHVSDISSNFKDVVCIMADFQKSAMEIDAKLKLASKNLDLQIAKEQNKAEGIKRGLELIKNTTNKLLEKALTIDYASCSDREYEMAHKIIEHATDQNRRALNLIVKYFSSSAESVDKVSF